MVGFSNCRLYKEKNVSNKWVYLSFNVAEIVRSYCGCLCLNILGMSCRI